MVSQRRSRWSVLLWSRLTMLLPQISRTIQIIVRSMITPNQATSMKGTPNIYRATR